MSDISPTITVFFFLQIKSKLIICKLNVRIIVFALIREVTLVKVGNFKDQIGNEQIVYSAKVYSTYFCLFHTSTIIMHQTTVCYNISILFLNLTDINTIKRYFPIKLSPSEYVVATLHRILCNYIILYVFIFPICLC